MRPALRACLVAAALAVVAAAAAQDPRPIRLPSGTVIPTEGIDPKLEEHLRNMGPDDGDRVHVVLHFSEYPSDAERKLLETKGIRMLDIVPERSSYASIPADLTDFSALMREFDPLVVHARMLSQADKLSKAFGNTQQPQFPEYTARDGDAGEVVIAFYGDFRGTAAQEQILDSLGVTFRARLQSVNGWRAFIKEGHILQLADFDEVRWIEPGPPAPEDDNDGVRSPTGLDSNILYPAVPAIVDGYNLTGADVSVAQFESKNGSTAHSDFGGRLLIGDQTTPQIPLFTRSHAHDESVGANHTYDIGEMIYVDMDDSLTVSEDDWRLTTTDAANFPLGEVDATDDEIGTAIKHFWTTYPDYESFADRQATKNLIYDPSEWIYQNKDYYDHPVYDHLVSDGDVRITPVSILGQNYAAGSTVKGCEAGSPPDCVADADINLELSLFPTDPHIHATHVAGIVAGNGASSDKKWSDGSVCNTNGPMGFCNGGSAGQWQGVAPGATINSFRVKNVTNLIGAGCLMNPNLSCKDGLGDDYPIAIDNGATISTNSWGWGSFSYCDYAFLLGGPGCVNDPGYDIFSQHYDVVVSGRSSDDAVDPYDHQMLVVASAGNRGNHWVDTTNDGFVDTRLDWKTVRVRNAAKNTLTVGNITSDTNKLAPDSSRGPTNDGRIKPDVVGPGSQRVEEFPPNPRKWVGGVRSPAPVNRYATMSGTSMSTPGVSGTAALMTEYYRRFCGGNGPSPNVLKAGIIQSAVDFEDVPHVSGTFPEVDFAFGFGLVKANTAVDLAARHVEGEISSADPVKTYDFHLGAVADLKFTMTWDDPAWPAGITHSQDHGFLVNDLDLELIYKPGTTQEHTYRPWRPSAADPYAPAVRGTDNRNTVEQVWVKNAQAGQWRLRVSQSQLYLSPQKFAISGEHVPSAVGNCVEEEVDEKTVDVWAKDYPGDDGNAPSAIIPVWIGPDVWNNRGGLPSTTHENPVAGRTNFLYAKLRNRGSAAAHATSIDFWAAKAGLGLEWPEAFTWIGRLHAPHIAADGATEVVGPLRWRPSPAISDTHYAIYARINSPVDPIALDFENESIFRNVRDHNNIVWKNFQVLQLVPLDVLLPVAGYREPRFAVSEFDFRNGRDKSMRTDFVIKVDRDESRHKSDIFIEIPTELVGRASQLSVTVNGLEAVDDKEFGSRSDGVSRFRLTDKVAYVRDALLEPGAVHPVRLFVLADRRYNEKATIDITQEASGRVVDGIRIEVAPPRR